MTNALIALCTGLLIWALLMICVLALMRFAGGRDQEMSDADTIRDELDRQEMRTRKVRCL